MPAEPRLSDANLEALCDILGDTGTGLTGSEIGRFLRECNIQDPLPGYGHGPIRWTGYIC